MGDQRDATSTCCPNLLRCARAAWIRPSGKQLDLLLRKHPMLQCSPACKHMQYPLAQPLSCSGNAGVVPGSRGTWGGVVFKAQLSQHLPILWLLSGHFSGPWRLSRALNPLEHGMELRLNGSCRHGAGEGTALAAGAHDATAEASAYQPQHGHPQVEGIGSRRDRALPHVSSLQTSRVQAPVERRDGPGPQMRLSLALLSLQSGTRSRCFNEESRSGMMV